VPETRCVFVLAFNSSDFLNYSENSWCASVGMYGNEIDFYANDWTEDQHYICQYDCE